MKIDDITKYFEYLDRLRKSGKTNMFGARPYLADEFNLDDDEAKKILLGWMKTFHPDISADKRAKQFLKGK